MAQVLVQARREHPTWGPKKLLALLERQQPGRKLPAASTVGEVLKREGLVQPRRRRPKQPGARPGLTQEVGPNDVWCADFKGHFCLGDGQRCHPLTVTDNASRMLLLCQGLERPSEEGCRKYFERLFREYGLPGVLRTDNGTPFSSNALCGLSRLSIWWVRLGIRPERIEPGKPQQNGRHERMHRTLKQETAWPPKASMRAQQRAFDAFRSEYNQVRPHEALAMRTPASLYAPSPRPFPSKLPELVYPSGYEVRRVTNRGTLKLLGRAIFISECLVGEALGLEPVDDGRWALHFGSLLLGEVHAQDWKLHSLAELLARSLRDAEMA
jgi:transposase InsO family protein